MMTISLKRLANGLRMTKKPYSAWQQIVRELSQNGNKVYSHNRDVISIDYPVGDLAAACYFEYSYGVRDVSFHTMDRDYHGINALKQGLNAYIDKATTPQVTPPPIPTLQDRIVTEYLNQCDDRIMATYDLANHAAELVAQTYTRLSWEDRRKLINTLERAHWHQLNTMDSLVNKAMLEKKLPVNPSAAEIVRQYTERYTA